MTDLETLRAELAAANINYDNLLADHVIVERECHKLRAELKSKNEQFQSYARKTEADMNALAAENEKLRTALMAFADHFGPLEDNHMLHEDARRCFALARAALSPAVSAWQPTHRHVKRGTTYAVIGEAQLQTSAVMWDDVPMIVYRGEDGQLWTRPKKEFEDGRFEAIPAVREGT